MRDSEQAPGERTASQPGPIKRLDRPDQDQEPNLMERRHGDFGIGREPPGVQVDIADADKQSRSGATQEPVRNTPPAGDWNETTSD